ncbi:MAG: molybdopterin molybdotransferase MoeA [Lentimicrobium sp.]|nr:molybdopterin molybdotransferase MoeA [Lentimicrobium sp.]
MITFEEALNIINQIPVTTHTEQARLENAVGRVLATDIFSDVEMPPFDKAAVDGYACRRADLPGPFEVVEIIPAGVVPEVALAQGHCSKIMTGAMVPVGADTIIMVEYTEVDSNGMVTFNLEKTSSNIAYQAEDVKEGQLVLQKNTLLKPHHIAILAAVGVSEPMVFKCPVIGVISTGDELVEPDKKPRSGQIRNSNAHQLIAQSKAMGLNSVYLGIASDTPDSIEMLLEKGFNQCDILLLTGGVSMGDFDHVPAVLDKMGITVLFKSIAVQPGRPTVFGVKGNKFLFGLPGNPVSSYVQFELLVKQLAFRLMGHTYKPMIVKLPMAADFTRKKGIRKSFMPVKINSEGKIEPLEYHGSAHIHAYEGADGIMAIEIGETKIISGEYRDVRQLQ